MARYSQTIETYKKMGQEAQQDLWARLYEFMSEAPDNFPISEWRYGDLDIWPMLKGLIMLRAVRIFHNSQFDLLFLKEAQSADNSLMKYWEAKPKKKRFKARFGLKPSKSLSLKQINKKAVADLEARSRLVNELPNDYADVLCFGAEICCFPYGKYLVQNHLDPLRVCLEDQGFSTFCYLTDHDENEPFDRPFVVEGVAGFKNAFDRIQSGCMPSHVLDTSLLKGFDTFWRAATKIIPLDFLITDQIMQNVYRRTYSAKRALYQFFQYRKTKAVVLFAYYGILGWAASSAGRRHGIPVIDMQHGVTGPPHESYDFKSMPKAGYNTIPTQFLCWSDKETDALNETSQGHFKAYTVGQSWMLTEALMSSQKSFRNLPASRIEAANIGLADLRQNIVFGKASHDSGDVDKPVYAILVALQDDKDLTWLKEVCNNRNANWRFYLRLHPATVRNKALFESLARKNQSYEVNVREASTAPLNVLLPHMDIVVTHYSSTILDGIAFGKPGICYGEAGRWYFDWLGEDAPEYCSSHAVSLFQSLKSTEGSMRQPPGKQNVETFNKLFETLKEIMPEKEH